MSLALAVDKLEAKAERQVKMSSTHKVLVALQKAGSTGLTGVQLGRIVPRYSTRISDLRADGHLIVHTREGQTHRFVLVGER